MGGVNGGAQSRGNMINKRQSQKNIKASRKQCILVEHSMRQQEHRIPTQNDKLKSEYLIRRAKGGPEAFRVKQNMFRFVSEKCTHRHLAQNIESTNVLWMNGSKVKPAVKNKLERISRRSNQEAVGYTPKPHQTEPQFPCGSLTTSTKEYPSEEVGPGLGAWILLRENESGGPSRNWCQHGQVQEFWPVQQMEIPLEEPREEGMGRFLLLAAFGSVCDVQTGYSHRATSLWVWVTNKGHRTK